VKRVITLATLLALVALAGTGCVSREKYDQLQQIKDVQDRQLDELKRTLGELDRQKTDAKRKAELAQLELDKTVQQKNTLDEGYGKLLAQLKEWEGKMGQLPAGVTLEQRAEGLVFNVEGEVLFDSGRHKIKPEGERTLLDLAARIREQPVDLVVEGHTDNEPVRMSIKEYPKGNLDLSGRRALEVADFLIQQGKLEAKHVSFAGFGENRAKGDNATSTGRRQNRRVELLLRQRPPEK
jgi:flagellar motor protein MotB